MTKLAIAVAVIAAALGGAAASRAWTTAKPCNGQKPCVTMHVNSAYNATGAKLLCLYQTDLDNKPQLFCGPPQAKTAVYVLVNASTIEVDRVGGGKAKTLYTVKR